MTDHTPGPWTRKPGQRFRHDESAGVCGPDGSYVATALDFNRFDRDAEVEANARLIAAAPELLAALEAFAVAREHADECGCDDDCDIAFQLWASADKARAEAIAKAKGEVVG